MTYLEKIFYGDILSMFAHYIDYMIQIGLPVTFAEVGMDKCSHEELMAAAKTLTEPGNFIHNHVFPVTAYDLYSAMLKADALGRSRKALLN